MISIKAIFIYLIILPSIVFAVPNTELIVNADSGKYQISKHIYGHFAEHLGHCIYGGIWVGEKSEIPNIKGYRKDVVEALKEISIPNIRWPGGCFADTYHWMDAIGTAGKRAKIVNTTWGGVVEDNSFGTHEFLGFCELIGAEPYICINIGSGTVKEAQDWVEYVNSDENTPMATLRRQNGRLKPWNVKFWAIGNETWGCGGIMTAEYYANEMARYSYFLKNYGNNVLYKVASGGLPEDYNWTETTMKKWGTTDGWLQGYMSGYSLHFYTVTDWNKKGSATNFIEKDWFAILSKTLQMEELIKKHSAIMDKYDPQKKVGLIVDEWGTWYDVEGVTNPAFLYQQNSLRDALVAAINLNIFNNHCERVKMANISQLINVLQSVILTKDDKIVLTPTYYVFKMYTVHHDATLLPIDLKCEDYFYGKEKIPSISASASKDKDGKIHISIANLDPAKGRNLRCEIRGASVERVTGEIITANKINAYNDFGKPEEVKIQPFEEFKTDENNIAVTLPPKSIVMLEVR